MSKRIQAFVSSNLAITLSDFMEFPGKGLSAISNGTLYRLGSYKWLSDGTDVALESGNVLFSIDGKIKGAFKFHSVYRDGISDLVKELTHYDVHVLSGDNDFEEENLKAIMGDVPMKFEQSPEDKMKYVAKLKKQGKSVMMLGDGLNDAGALKQSDVGIAITEDIAVFSPACDGIFLGSELQRLGNILRFGKISRKIVIASFVLSFAYNLVGLSLAVGGALTPVFAAVLMPLSSISVVLFTTILSNYFGRKLKIG
ncbi:MAG: HAD-IC family P-type ATPase [Bacteroidota bacterium]